MRQQQAGIPARPSFAPLSAIFREHPASVGETYTEHMGFALRFSARLFCAGAAACIHALIPALFKTRASDAIRAMHAEIEHRG